MDRYRSWIKIIAQRVATRGATGALELMGGAVVCYGLWLIWPPLAFVTTGSAIILLAAVLGKEQ